MDTTIEDYVNGKLPRARSRTINTQLQILNLPSKGDLEKDKVQIIQFFIDEFRSSLIRSYGTSLTHRIKYGKLYSKFYKDGSKPIPCYLKGTDFEIEQIVNNPIQVIRK